MTPALSSIAAVETTAPGLEGSSTPDLVSTPATARRSVELVLLQDANLTVDLRDDPDRRDRHSPAYRRFVSFPGEQRWAACRTVERQVFGLDFGMSKREHADRYDPFDEASTFFGVCTADQAVVGCARVIVPSSRGLMSVQDMTELWGLTEYELERPCGVVLELSRAWDLATLAVLPGARQGAVSKLLYSSISAAVQRMDVPSLVSILDVHVHQLLRWVLKEPFRSYDVAPRPYAGSLSVPVWSDQRDYQRRLRADSPALFAQLFPGGGPGVRSVAHERGAHV